MIEGKFTGGKKFEAAIKKLEKTHQVKMDLAVAEGAMIIHGEAVRSIQAHMSKGITYGNHTASKPGYPPNTDTGRLVQSISVEKRKDMEWAVGTNNLVGVWMEFGTKNIAPRPWLSRAFVKTSKKVQAIIEKAWENVVNGL